MQSGTMVFTQMNRVIFGQPAAATIVAEAERLGAKWVFLLTGRKGAPGARVPLRRRARSYARPLAPRRSGRLHQCGAGGGHRSPHHVWTVETLIFFL